MSFKNNHINIDRNNYEEYFLMYVDNELTPAQRLAVEEFINNHPDLREELELLSSTILDAEPIRLFDKDSLLSHNIQKDVVDEQLLMYLDHELPQDEAGKIEKKLSEDPAYKTQYDWLLKTKLDQNEVIIYPYKNELYKTEKVKSIRPFYILRIAAAVVILLTSALLYIFSNDVNNEPTTLVQQTVKPQLPPEKNSLTEENTLPSSAEEKIEVNPSQELQLATVTEKNIVSKKSVADNQSTPVIFSADNEQTAFTELPQVEKQTSVEEKVLQQQNINTQPVTTIEALAYTSIDASETLVPGTDVFEGDEDKKGSVRGFLRKATRFIERRTGINAVNEDDELLIGAVAIKLK